MKLANILEPGVTSWREVHAALVPRNAPGNPTAGYLFEEFARYFFLAAPEYRDEFKNIWAETEIPTRVRKKLTLATRDHGVDLLLEDHEGRFHAVQCKFKTDQSKTLGWTKDRLSSWLAESDEAQGLIMFTNASGIDKQSTLKATKKDFTLVTVGDLLSLSPETTESILRLAQGKAPKKVKRFKPRPHQRRAINDVVKGFKTHDRGQLILPCGAGKTLAALWLKERLGAKRTLVLVPSLALLRQIRREWATQQKERLPYLCVCSEKDIDKDKRDVIVTHTFEVPGHVTTQPNEIAAFARKHRELVVYSTYQSLQAVIDAGVEFDLAICDEAHKTATARHNEFALVHDEQLRLGKRLYMTATPRVLSYQAKNALGEDAFATIADMSDEETFGPEFHRMGFGEAIDEGILSDYKIVVVGVSDRQVHKHIEQRTYLEDASADQIATSLALQKAMKKHGSAHALTFHSKVSRAKTFKDIHAKRVRSANVEHVNGSMSTNERLVLLDEFKDAPRAVMTNARCLTEGVDVPAIDCVAFVDPKHSKIDIVQAAGRALRLGGDDKDYGVILIPVFYEVGEGAEEIASTGVFKNVFEVVRSMADHDTRLQAEITALRLGEGKRGVSGGRIVIEPDEEERMVFEGFENSLKRSLFTQVIDRVLPPGKLLTSTKGLLTAQEFAEAIGLHYETVARCRRDGTFPCFGYVQGGPSFRPYYHPDQIEEYAQAFGYTLSLSDIKKHSYLNEKEFAHELGVTNVAVGRWRDQGKIQPIGWRGRFAYYARDQVQQMLEELGVEDVTGLLSTSEAAEWFQVEEGTINNWRRNQGLPFAKTTYSKGVNYYYDERDLERFRDKLGITLDSKEGLLSTVDAAERLGCTVTHVKALARKGKLEPEGYAMGISGVAPFYHPKVIDKIKLKRLTPDIVRKIYNDPGTGVEIAKKYRTSRANVSLIKNGKSWAHVTGHKTGATE